MQRLKGALRKVAALGTGVAMFGATLTGALAQLDLANYPAPFVVDGTYDTANAIVVGADAAASDTLASVDIASNLQFESKTCVAKGSGDSTVSVSGDAVEVGDKSDLLELGEPMGEVRETVTETELDGLRGGTITTSEGTTEYNQYLRFSEDNVTIRSPGVNFSANDDPNEQVADFLFVREGTATTDAFFEYEIEFEEGLESKITSGSLPGVEDEEIVILGQTYVFVDTTVDTSANSVTLELLGGTVFDTLEEGEVKTYTVEGKDYEVEVLIVEDVQPETVTLVVNGEVTDQLDEGETEVLEDGALIGISDIVANEAGEAGSGDIVEFYIGATKLEMTDDEYIDDLFSQKVRSDQESIEDAFVQIKASELESATKLEVLTIKYRLVADAIPGQANIFVPEGHGVREYLDEPEGMLGNWDIKYEGLDDTGVSIVKFDPAGDDRYNLEFENRQGQIYTFPLISNEGGTWTYGDADNEFVFGEAPLTVDSNLLNDLYNIGDNDWFLLSEADTPNDENAISHIVRYGSIDTANNQLTFDDLATGTRDVTYEITNESAGSLGAILGKFELVFGGNSYTGYVMNNSNVTAANALWPLNIDLNGNGSTSTREEARITVNGGGILDLGSHNRSWGYFDSNQTTNNASAAGRVIDTTDASTTSSVNMTLTTLSTEFDEDGPTSGGATNEVMSWNITTRTGNEIGIGDGSLVRYGLGVAALEPDDDEDHKYQLSEYGVFFDLFDQAGTTDAETLTIEYPLKQRGTRVFITMGDTAVTKTKAGEVCTVADITPRTLLDSEVSDPTDYNVVAVGGPCANDVVARIAGFPTCDSYRSMYKDGEAIIQLAENGENVALLVAGYNAIDTRKAGKVLANWEDYDLSGAKVKVTGQLSSPSVSLG